MKSKKHLRKELKRKREIIPNEMKNVEESLIIEYFLKSNIYKSSQNIFIYKSFGYEFDTSIIIEKSLDDEKEIYLPVVNFNEHDMYAYRYSREIGLLKDNYGIYYPNPEQSEMIEPVDIDLAIVPLLGFDKSRVRIGYGGGYYDRYLPKMRKDALKIGFAFSNQIVENMPKEAFDIALDYIISVIYEEDRPYVKVYG